MAKSKWQYFFFGIAALFTSCQVVRYVGINNYQDEPRHVTVGYSNSSDILWESDTLNAGALGADSFSTYIIRKNTGPQTYTFVLPDSLHVELMPKGVVNPFDWVKIATGTDTLYVNLRDKAQLKKLKRERIVETSGIPESMFLINIGKPSE